MTKADADPTAERLDIEACEENLGIYAKAGDARSCRDIGLALARELTAVRERADVLEDLAGWLVSLDDPEDVVGREERRTVTLDQIITRACAALGKDG